MILSTFSIFDTSQIPKKLFFTLENVINIIYDAYQKYLSFYFWATCGWTSGGLQANMKWPFSQNNKRNKMLIKAICMNEEIRYTNVSILMFFEYMMLLICANLQEKLCKFGQLYNKKTLHACRSQYSFRSLSFGKCLA